MGPKKKAKPNSLKFSRLRQDRNWKLEIEGKVKSEDKIDGREREEYKRKRKRVSLQSIILLYTVWTFGVFDQQKQNFFSFSLCGERKSTRSTSFLNLHSFVAVSILIIFNYFRVHANFE